MAFECLSLYREYREMVLMNLFAGSNGDTSSFTGKESACNAGDPSSIPELGRSPGDGKGYPLQYSGLENSMDYTVRAVAKSQTRLGDFTFTFHFHALEKAMATHSSVLAWRIPWMEKPGGLQSIGLQRVGDD